MFTTTINSFQKAWWNDAGDIVLDNGVDKEKFIVNKNDSTWSRKDVPAKKAVAQNESYRVFCGTTKNALYSNALYVRTLSGDITTRALVAQSARVNNGNRQVALVFDADENPDGLDVVLALCHSYGLKCNFFFNGEFVRRYPKETREIAKSGHECAAIFFNNIDLTNKLVYDDNKFVSKGLVERRGRHCFGQRR